MSTSHSTDRKSFCVLGIDPAAAGATGYGVVESDGKNCRMLRYGALRPVVSLRNPLCTHLRDIHSLIAALIEEFQPQGVALESVFASLNVKTALRLAEVRGVVLLAAAQAGIPSFSYSPREVKANVAGYGHAGKEQVQQMVKALLGMSETPEPADAADALAVALCHLQNARARNRFAMDEDRVIAPGLPRKSKRRNPESGPRILSLR